MCVTVHRSVHMNTYTCMATFIEAPQPKCPLQTSLSPLEDKGGGQDSQGCPAAVSIPYPLTQYPMRGSVLIVWHYRGDRRKEGSFGLGPRSPQLTQNSLELCTGTFYWSNSGRMGTRVSWPAGE